jgi:hypothetical protein
MQLLQILLVKVASRRSCQSKKSYLYFMRERERERAVYMAVVLHTSHFTRVTTLPIQPAAIPALRPLDIVAPCPTR